eukprot:UN33784
MDKQEAKQMIETRLEGIEKFEVPDHFVEIILADKAQSLTEAESSGASVCYIEKDKCFYISGDEKQKHKAKRILQELLKQNNAVIQTGDYIHVLRGLKGERIRNIEKTYKVRLQSNGENLVILGPVEEVNEAKKDIESMLSRVKVIEIGNDLPFLIGNSGSQIAKIRNECSQTSIITSDSGKVYILGDSEIETQKAIDLVEKI